MALSPQEQILQSYENWFALNALYDKWAKAHGLTSNGLMTLYAIRIFPCCTQRTICEALALPKQTVNTILDGMQKKGYIRLDVLPTDRRSKRICLTPQGEAYAGPILDALDALEWRALQGMGHGTDGTKAGAGAPLSPLPLPSAGRRAGPKRRMSFPSIALHATRHRAA